MNPTGLPATQVKTPAAVNCTARYRLVVSPKKPLHIQSMGRSDADVVRETEATIREHHAAIKKEAHARIMQMSSID